MGFDIDNVSMYYKGKRMMCSNCIHAASKNRYINTVPSIHTCMNNHSCDYLEDNAWSHFCRWWELMPNRFEVIDVCETFDDDEYRRLMGWE